MDGRTAAPLAAPRAGRWTAPVFLALAQLMIALGATITNVALPSVGPRHILPREFRRTRDNTQVWSSVT